MSWPRLYAHVCANTGWTWQYVRDQLDLPTLDALQAEWQHHPPVHHLVAAYLDYKPPQATAADSDQQLAQFLSGMRVDTSAPQIDDSAWQQAITAKPPSTTDAR